MEGTLDQPLTASRVAPGGEDEAAWIRASQRGDTMAFNRLVLRWETPIFNLALRMLQDPDEAADVTQEVFIAAYRSIRRFRARARFSTWLYRIASNRCLSRLRRRGVRRHPSLDSDADATAYGLELSGDDSPENDLLSSERRRLVTRALSALAPGNRIVVELKIYQEQTFEEIAAILRLPQSTTKSRFYAGVAELRRVLARSLAPGTGARS